MNIFGIHINPYQLIIYRCKGVNLHCHLPVIVLTHPYPDISVVDTPVPPGVKKEAALSSETIETISTQDTSVLRMPGMVESNMATENHPLIDRWCPYYNLHFTIMYIIYVCVCVRKFSRATLEGSQRSVVPWCPMLLVLYALTQSHFTGKVNQVEWPQPGNRLWRSFKHPQIPSEQMEKLEAPLVSISPYQPHFHQFPGGYKPT